MYIICFLHNINLSVAILVSCSTVATAFSSSWGQLLYIAKKIEWVYVTGFWKITHMGANDTVNI